MPLSEAARVRVLRWFAARGSRTRQIASRFDLATSMGLRHSRTALLNRQRLNEFGGGARDALYRYIWSDAAAELGAEVVELSHDILELRRDRKSTRVWHQITMFDDAVTLHMSLDKPLMHSRLRDLDLPVPDHLVYRPGNLGPALDFLASAHGQTFVVKPAEGTGGGEGVTTGVRSPQDLARATLRASRFSREVLIENQPDGSVLRVLFFQGELLDAISQGQPQLRGDGRSTIAELIASENERRFSAQGRHGPSPLRIDLDCVLHLRHTGRRLDDVPVAGEVFTVKGVTNENTVGDSRRVASLSPGLVDQCRRAYQATGLQLVGIDLIVKDPARDERSTILEVNGGPGLHHHYLVADGEPARVAVPILDALLT